MRSVGGIIAKLRPPDVRGCPAFGGSLKRLLFFLAVGAGCALPAYSQIRVVNYNTLDGPTPGVHDNSANMQTIFSAIATQSVNGVAKRPDLLILQEQTNSSAAAMATLLNAQFPGAAYVAVTPSGQPGSTDPVFIDRQSFVYDSSAIQLIGTAVSVATGGVRPVIRGQFRPVGYASADANFYAYGAHLKAGATTDDRNNRALQTAAMRANVNGFGAGAHALFAGDFNMQSNQEQAWLNMVTGAGEGLAVDPLNPTNASQTWNNNATFAPIHTQSTRTGFTPDSDGGATGGMDDRFDVQLSTQEFHDGEGLSYIANSTRAFGNDGQHFNLSLNANPIIPLGATVANALWDASDHLPVVADYQLPAKMAFTKTIAEPTQVIVGGSATATFKVQNTAPVLTANGADELDYLVSTSGNGVGSFSSTTNTTNAGNNHIVALSTSTPGVKSAIVSATASSQAAEGAAASISLSTTVLAHATPSFDPAVTTTTRTIDFGIHGRGEAIPAIQVLLNNRADPSGFTAGLDLDSVNGTGSTAQLALAIAAGAPSIAAGANREGSVSFASGTIGSFSSTYSLATSDQDLPGAINLSALTLNLTGRIALPGDANLDNAVNLDDFTILASSFGSSGQIWQSGEFTHDGSVTLDDFTLLAANFGATAIDLPRSAIPEPTGIALIASSVMLLSTRHPRRAVSRRRTRGSIAEIRASGKAYRNDRWHRHSCLCLRFSP